MYTNNSSLYLVRHNISASEAQIQCLLDSNKNLRISSVKMISGNIVALSGVRSALAHFQEECGLQNEEPNRSA